MLSKLTGNANERGSYYNKLSWFHHWDRKNESNFKPAYGVVSHRYNDEVEEPKHLEFKVHTDFVAEATDNGWVKLSECVQSDLMFKAVKNYVRNNATKNEKRSLLDAVIGDN